MSLYDHLWMHAYTNPTNSTTKLTIPLTVRKQWPMDIANSSHIKSQWWCLISGVSIDSQVLHLFQDFIIMEPHVGLPDIHFEDLKYSNFIRVAMCVSDTQKLYHFLKKHTCISTTILEY